MDNQSRRGCWRLFAFFAGDTEVRGFFRTMMFWHRWFALTDDARATGKAITGASNLLFLFLIASGLINQSFDTLFNFLGSSVFTLSSQQREDLEAFMRELRLGRSESEDRRDLALLRSECAVAANSASMAHMANISFQLAETAELDQLERAYSGSIAYPSLAIASW